MLPNFTIEGFLPEGIHSCSLIEFEERFCNNYKRKKLFIGLQKMIEIVKQFGEPFLYIDGSFVTDKQIPGDYDACLDFRNDNLYCYKNLIQYYPVFGVLDNGRMEQKNEFGGEVFPAFLPEGNSKKLFLDFFQSTKDTNVPKGIVLIEL